MTGPHAAAHRAAEALQQLTLIWIDGRGAVIVRAEQGAPTVERLASDVPPHHRSTGHRRVKAFAGHGARGPEAGHPEHDRLEHRRAFLADVTHRIPHADRVVVLGPGPTRDHLAAQLRGEPARRVAGGTVEVRPSGVQTDAQLLASFRDLAGIPVRRTRPAS